MQQGVQTDRTCSIQQGWEFLASNEDDYRTSCETSVNVNNNSPIQDYVHPNDQTQPTFEMLCSFAWGFIEVLDPSYGTYVTLINLQ